MTLIRPSVDYTAKDFDALSERLFNIIPSAFPDWTEDQIANFGNLLVEMFAYVGDVLLFYQDNQARESRWSTALLRRSIISAAKLVGYQPRGASGAQATLTVRLASIPVGNVTFAVGDRFSTADTAKPVIFQVLSQTVIAAGSNPPVGFLVVENSTSVSDALLSTGLPHQSFVLTGSPYIEDTLSITADDGVYTIVDDLLESSATARHAVVSLDENSRLHVTFGNGIAGAIPVGTITFNYRTGGGSAGNVARGTIVKALQSYSDSFGNTAIVTVVNASNAGGGSEIQTVESIREDVPRQLRVLTRTVCREDYEIVASRVAGVARALMLTRDEKPTIQENRGILYVVPEGGGVATQALLTAVTKMWTVDFPKTITFKPLALSAVYLMVDITTRIHVRRGHQPAVVGAAVKKALADFFAATAPDGSRNGNVDFGYYMDGALAWSDVFNVIRDTPGVRKIDDGLGDLVINGNSDDLVVPPERFPLLGEVVVINAETGAAL